MNDAEAAHLMRRERYARSVLKWMMNEYRCRECRQLFLNWPLYRDSEGFARCDAHAPNLPGFVEEDERFDAMPFYSSLRQLSVTVAGDGCVEIVLSDDRQIARGFDIAWSFADMRRVVGEFIGRWERYELQRLGRLPQVDTSGEPIEETAGAEDEGTS